MGLPPNAAESRAVGVGASEPLLATHRRNVRA